MEYHEHKKYFETAYKSGADIWTHLPITARGQKMLAKLSSGAKILDVGSGRGIFAKEMAEMGFSVTGIDFEGSIVTKANLEIKNWGVEGKLTFVEGNAFNMPFVDGSFDAVCDFGLFQHFYREDWSEYSNEIFRVLKPGGVYTSVSLSRETPRFFEFFPVGSIDGDFVKYGINYHFFSKEEMQQIFSGKLKLISQETEFIEVPIPVVYLESLFQK